MGGRIFIQSTVMQWQKNIGLGKMSVFCLVVSWICLIIITGCKYFEQKQLITKKVLQTKIKPGVTTRLVSLANRNSGTICILYPYQEEIRDEIPDKELLNSHLKKIQYYSDEGDWAILFFEGNTIDVSSYNTSKNLGIIAKHQLVNVTKMQLPIGFKPLEKNCLPIVQAIATKVEFENHQYIIIGEDE